MSDSQNACRRLLPLFAPLVQQCLLSTKLNSCGGLLELLKTRSSTPDFEDRECDRFTLGIPYCGVRIEWEVIFERAHPSHPPDIIFNEDDDELNFAPSLEQLESLRNWDPEDEKALCHLLEEILIEYNKHHLKILSKHQRYLFELSSLAESDKYADFAVHCRMTDAHQEPEVRFYIPFQMDFNALPTYLTKDNPGPDVAALIVIFRPDDTRVTPELILSPRVERVLGGSKSLRIPPWGNTSGTCLIDYAPIVHNMLEDKVNSIVQSYVQRKEYIAAMLSIFGASVLEYNTESFKNISFLFEHQGFSFILHIRMTDAYPVSQPSATLASVYHRKKGNPCQCDLSNYPYSPRWSVDEMIERLRGFVIQMVPQFMELTKERGECL